MKRRNTNESGENRRKDQWNMMKTKKNEKRLGGKALSLESFANAKSRSSGYNPSIIKKQREFYRNAKYVSKFKKSIKREGQPESSLTATRFEDANDDEIERRPKSKTKKKKDRVVNLHDITKEFEKKRAEAEKAKMEMEAMIEQRKEEKARAEAKRKTQRVNMFKKTRSGQPIMKYRIENLLQGILQDSTK